MDGLREELKERSDLNIKKGGDAIPVDNFVPHKSIKTRTSYVLCGSDFSQQELCSKAHV